MNRIVVEGVERELDDTLDRPSAPEASEAPRSTDSGLVQVVAAMQQLQSAIDTFLGIGERPGAAPEPISKSRSGFPRGATGPGVPVPVTLSGLRPRPDPPPTPEDGGWERAATVRSHIDPQQGWIEANSALRRGEHAKAFECFESEADRAAADGDHARAAVAYRMASDAATALGRRDSADYNLRRAGKHYLFVAESPTSSLQTMYRSYLTASRCFLAVGNLELTQSCVTRALALQQTMNEDLHTRFNGPVQDAR